MNAQTHFDPMEYPSGSPQIQPRPGRLENRVVLITGGTSGIGKATALVVDGGHTAR